MNKSSAHSSGHTLAWIIALLFVAVAAFWFGLSQRRPEEPAQAPAPLPTTPPAAVAIPNAAPAVTATTQPRIADDLIYTNAKYGFTLELPPRWKSYRVSEHGDAMKGNNLNFELKHNDGSYASAFVISAYARKDWDRLQSEEGPKPSYLAEKGDTVFGYSFAQDDSNFAGFGEAEPGLRYKGPIFDAQEIIIPSFQLR